VTASLKQFLKFNMQTYKFKLIRSHSVVMLLKKEITDNSLSKLTVVNFNYNALKLFSYVEISVNKISYLDINI